MESVVIRNRKRRRAQSPWWRIKRPTCDHLVPALPELGVDPRTAIASAALSVNRLNLDPEPLILKPEEDSRDNSYRLKDKLKAGLVRPAEATE
ncbi:MAG: hypothetical protein ACREK9_18680 [Candidatus Rokuibacteriota bacterium]